VCIAFFPRALVPNMFHLDKHFASYVQDTEMHMGLHVKCLFSNFT
jgi:hypothetical protein